MDSGGGRIEDRREREGVGLGKGNISSELRMAVGGGKGNIASELLITNQVHLEKHYQFLMIF